MADKFNGFFTNKAHEIVEKIQPTDQDLSLENTQSTLPNTNFKFNFIDNPLTLQEVNDAILKLNPKTSLDYDGISTRFLKIVAPIISKPLFYFLF